MKERMGLDEREQHADIAPETDGDGRNQAGQHSRIRDRHSMLAEFHLNGWPRGA
jgi:hypothetical protein